MGWFICVFVLFPIFVIIYNKVTVSKNDGQKVFNQYYGKIIKFSLNVPKVDDPYSDKLQTDFTHYRAGASPIGYKAVSGAIISVSFFDISKKKYFKINLYDVDSQQYFGVGNMLEGKTIDAYVNQDDLANPLYGTKVNPIPIFKFKGSTEVIGVESTDKNGKDIVRSLETNDAEFKHNVLTYLTYSMSKKEFGKRFENTP